MNGEITFMSNLEVDGVVTWCITCESVPADCRAVGEAFRCLLKHCENPRSNFGFKSLLWLACFIHCLSYPASFTSDRRAKSSHISLTKPQKAFLFHCFCQSLTIVIDMALTPKLSATYTNVSQNQETSNLNHKTGLNNLRL